jgi:hypothetical protein
MGEADEGEQATSFAGIYATGISERGENTGS